MRLQCLCRILCNYSFCVSLLGRFGVFLMRTYLLFLLLFALINQSINQSCKTNLNSLIFVPRLSPASHPNKDGTYLVDFLTGELGHHNLVAGAILLPLAGCRPEIRSKNRSRRRGARTAEHGFPFGPLRPGGWDEPPRKRC